MAFGETLKVLVQRCANAFGYRIEKCTDPVCAPIDVLDLVLTKVAAHRPDFFFVQIGANDGLTDDPLRQFVTKYHWHGVLVEPQPQVFQQLLTSYEQEKQLSFENAAIADKDGTAQLFVADHRDATANLTVFASLKKDALIRGLKNPKASGVQVQVQALDVPALSVKTLLSKHQITNIDLLLTDVQGYDSEVVEQFLACGVKPTIIHFEHCHTARATLERLYRKLFENGYRFNGLQIDTLCYLPSRCSGSGERLLAAAEEREMFAD
ncbi:MAG: FkbM family methyltransferase [Acidobacteria bacterium]|nr:FkbM family methyltransferase [Acidobacteriota bacterium]